MSVAIMGNLAVREVALPVTVEQYHKLSEAGIVAEKTELIGGVIIQKMTKSPQHANVVRRLFNMISSLTPDDYTVLKEDPLTLVDSEPEPDIAIVPGSLADYASAHPGSAALVIEVAGSSLALDRAKLSIYANANVSVAWIVILESQSIEVHSNPKAGSYLDKAIFSLNGQVALPFLNESSLNVADIFH